MKRTELNAATMNTWVVPIDGAKTGPWLSFIRMDGEEVEFINQVDSVRGGYTTLPVAEVLKDWEVWNP